MLQWASKDLRTPHMSLSPSPAIKSKTQSCAECRRRRIRCDGQAVPCSQCVYYQVPELCHYPARKTRKAPSVKYCYSFCFPETIIFRYSSHSAESMSMCPMHTKEDEAFSTGSSRNTPWRTSNISRATNCSLCFPMHLSKCLPRPLLLLALPLHSYQHSLPRRAAWRALATLQLPPF
jgi:hypothetical protein